MLNSEPVADEGCRLPSPSVFLSFCPSGLFYFVCGANVSNQQLTEDAETQSWNPAGFSNLPVGERSQSVLSGCTAGLRPGSDIPGLEQLSPDPTAR